MKRESIVFAFIGALAYGWLLAMLTKNGMPDIMALAASIIAPLSAGLVLGRPLAKAYSIAPETSDKKELLSILLGLFCLLSVGIAAGNAVGVIAQRNSWLGNDREKEVEMWRKILKDDNDKVGSRLFDKYLGKGTTGNAVTPNPATKQAQ